MDPGPLQHASRNKNGPFDQYIQQNTQQFVQSQFFDDQQSDLYISGVNMIQKSQQRLNFYVKSIHKGDLESINDYIKHQRWEYEDLFDQEMDLFAQFFDDTLANNQIEKTDLNTSQQFSNYYFQNGMLREQDEIQIGFDDLPQKFQVPSHQSNQEIIQDAIHDYIWLQNDNIEQNQSLQMQIQYSQQILDDMYITEYQMVSDSCQNVSEDDALQKIKQVQAQSPHVFAQLMRIDRSQDKRLSNIYKDYYHEYQNQMQEKTDIICQRLDKPPINSIIMESIPYMKSSYTNVDPSAQAFIFNRDNFDSFIDAICIHYIPASLSSERFQTLKKAFQHAKTLLNRNQLNYTQNSIKLQMREAFLQKNLFLVRNRVKSFKEESKHVGQLLVSKHGRLQREYQMFQNQQNEKAEQIQKLRKDVDHIVDEINIENKTTKQYNMRLQQLSGGFSVSIQEKLQALRDDIEKRRERLAIVRQEAEKLTENVQSLKERLNQAQSDEEKQKEVFDVHQKKADSFELDKIDKNKLHDVVSGIFEPLTQARQAVKRLKQVQMQREDTKVKLAKLRTELEMLTSQTEENAKAGSGQ